MKKYIAVLEIEDNEEIVDAKISYIYSSNDMNYKATERMELKEENEDAKNKTYEDGLKEAWELARDIIAMPNSENKSLIGVVHNALGNETLYDIIRNYSASEIIEEIKKYEEIKVGDEVELQSGLGVILESDEDSTTVMKPNGGVFITYNKTVLKKTGRHFPQIEEVLKQMKEGEDE